MKKRPQAMSLGRIFLICDRVLIFAFCALIYFLPISTALVEIFCGLILAAFAVKLLSERFFFSPCKRRPDEAALTMHIRFLPPVFLKAMMVLVAATVLSVIFSQDPAASLEAFFFKFLQGIVLTLAFTEAFVSIKTLSAWTGVLTVSALLISVNGFFQAWRGQGFIFDDIVTDGRIMSSFNHPNDFGGYLVVVVPVMWSLAVYFWGRLIGRKGRLRERVGGFLMFGAIFAAALGCLGLTYSRAAWAGGFLGLLLVGLWCWRSLPAAVGIGIAFFMFFTPQMISTRNVSFISDNAQRWGLEDSPASQEREKASFVEKVAEDVHQFRGMGRAVFWRDAWTLFRHHPIFGSGLNTYYAQSQLLIPEWNGYYAHNCYLQMAVETGVCGLAAFLALMAAVFLQMFRTLRQARSCFLSALLIGALGGLAAFLFQSAFDTNLYSVRLANLLWLILGILLAGDLMLRRAGKGGTIR